jgi:NAD(P)-dependent dehydrogenase (short-subunit alcohol dehydrogenase family)
MSTTDPRLPWSGPTRSDRFAGRRALVTGAASGIGAATAARLVAEGAQVAGLAIRWGVDESPLFTRLTVDVRDPAGVGAAVTDAIAALEGIPDVLVNAAGVYRVHSLLETTPEEWDEVLTTNLQGTFLVATSLVRAGMGPGAIVNIGSVAAFRGSTDEMSGVYNASKAAVLSLTGQMALEWAGRGIRVVAVAPGVIDTPMLRLMDDPIAGQEYLDVAVPLRRVGTAGEVAAVICFAASAEAAYLTGTTIVVDGGLLAE